MCALHGNLVCQSRQFTGRLASGLTLALLLALPGIGQANTLKVCSAQGSCGEAQLLDDEQLAAEAGKFTIAGDVVGMTINMLSSWQTGNGQHLQGKANVSITLPNGGNPAHSSIHTEASISGPQDAAPTVTTGSVAGGSGIRNVNGVSQLVQIAGDGNGAVNSTGIDVSSTPAINSAAANGAANATYTAANGAQASANVGSNGIRLTLSVPGAGLAQQQVNAAGLGNLQQSIQINANQQQIINQMQLQIQMRPLTGNQLAAQGFSNAINALRGK